MLILDVGRVIKHQHQLTTGVAPTSNLHKFCSHASLSSFLLLCALFPFFLPDSSFKLQIGPMSITVVANMIRRTARSSLSYLHTSFLIILFLAAFYKLHTISPLRLPTILIHHKNQPGCPSFPSADNVVISIKTGATEASSKIPALMQTSLRCAQNTHIFSDLKQDIGPYHLHDILSNVSPAVKAHPDFDLYHQQQASLHNLSALREMKSVTHPEKYASWVLDKYKFLPMAERAWLLQPEKDWYVFIDADTYLVYPNLLLWLETLDPNERLYLGSEVITNEGIPFAHGGTGYVLSKALVRELVAKKSAKNWEGKIEPWCCGDIVLAIAIQEDAGTRLTQSWPLTQGERAVEVPFGGASPEFWCRGVVSFHHLSPVEMGHLGEFERWWEGSSDVSFPCHPQSLPSAQGGKHMLIQATATTNPPNPLHLLRQTPHPHHKRRLGQLRSAPRARRQNRRRQRRC